MERETREEGLGQSKDSRLNMNQIPLISSLDAILTFDVFYLTYLTISSYLCLDTISGDVGEKYIVQLGEKKRKPKSKGTKYIKKK